MYGQANARSSAGCAGCCNIVAAIFLLFSTVSPFWVWARAVTWTWYTGASITLSVGAFVQSYSSASISSPGIYGWSNYYLWVGDVTNAACNSSIPWVNSVVDVPQLNQSFTQFGQYFCTEPNGEYKVPTEMKTIQAFTILALIFSLFGGIMAMSESGRGSKKGVGAAGCLTFLAMIFSIVSFSVATTWEYFKKLRVGEAGILVPNAGVEPYAVFTLEGGLYFGAAYWGVVVSFIILFFTTISILGASKQIEDDLDGGRNPDPDAPLEGQEQQSSAADIELQNKPVTQI